LDFFILEVTFPSVSANHFYKKKKKKTQQGLLLPSVAAGAQKMAAAEGQGMS
jgi:hypothetical protein